MCDKRNKNWNEVIRKETRQTGKHIMFVWPSQMNGRDKKSGNFYNFSCMFNHGHLLFSFLRYFQLKRYLFPSDPNRHNFNCMF